ncbi:ABC transporter permease [Chloroflexota bacterium]
MRTYIIRRLLMMIPTVFLATLIVFFSVRFIPGNVIDLMVSEMAGEGGGGGTQATAEHIRHALGLDVPVHIQYVRWMGDILRGDLGTSLWSGTPVIEEIAHRFPVSFELVVLAIIIALLIALPIGVYSAVRQDTLGDYAGRSFAILCISIPSFWSGTMVMIYPAIWWNWSPSMEYIPITQNIAGNLLQFIVPAFILGMVLSGVTMRMTRTMVLEVMRQDYIRTAWAKGLTEWIVIWRHAAKNALIPIITVVGVQLAMMIGGAVVLEQIFVLPGIANLLIDALTTRDYPVVSGINVVVASLVVIINLCVDLTYGFLDPRVQYN